MADGFGLAVLQLSCAIFVAAISVHDVLDEQNTTESSSAGHRLLYSPVVEAIVRKPTEEPQSPVHVSVKVIVPSPESRHHNKSDNIIRYSSNLMEFNEDTRKYFVRENRMNSAENPPNAKDNGCEDDLTTIARDRPRRRRKGRKEKKTNVLRMEDGEERIRRRRKRNNNKKNCRTKRREEQRRNRRKRERVRAVLRDEGYSQRIRKDSFPRSPGKIPIPKPGVIALTSPRKVFIRVWENSTEDDSDDDAMDMKKCVRCPVHMVLIPGYLEDQVILPVPALSICSKLAHLKGRLNMAVTSGPRPGTPLGEGEYPIELIAWKKNYVSYCTYAVSVRVKKCPDIKLPPGVFMDCSKGNVWGSICAFSCIYKNEILHGSSSTRCLQNGSNGVDWEHLTLPFCRETSMNKCKGPPSPINGVLVCGSNPPNGLYEHGSVCRYFCEPGYEMISHESNGHYPFHCQDGRWSPTVEISCRPSHCPYPKVSNHGWVKCDIPMIRKTKVPRGSTCVFGCLEGYVIPSTHHHLTIVSCNGPQWNSTDIPLCKRSITPSLKSNCRNRTYVVEVGESFQLTSAHLPHFTSSDKKIVASVCNPFYEGHKLKPGVYLNRCHTKDFGTILSSKCSYHIIIREKISPISKECKTKVKYVTANDGTVTLQSIRFNISIPDKEGWRRVRAKCSLTDQPLTIGTYTNNCTIFDHVLNMTGNCVHSVIVKERSCAKLRALPNSKLVCKLNGTKISNSYPVGTECSYKCNKGYFIPKLYLDMNVRRCSSSFRWDTTRFPFCKSMYGFRLKDSNDCNDKIVELEEPDVWQPVIPMYVSTVEGGDVEVDCSLKKSLGPGNYTNICMAKDLESGLQLSCKYNVYITYNTSVQEHDSSSASPFTDNTSTTESIATSDASATESMSTSDGSTTESTSTTGDATTTESISTTGDATTTESISTTGDATTMESTSTTGDATTTESISTTGDATTTESTSVTGDVSTTESTSTNDANATESSSMNDDANTTMSVVSDTEFTLTSDANSTEFTLTTSEASTTDSTSTVDPNTAELTDTRDIHTLDLTSTQDENCPELTAPLNGNLSCESNKCNVSCRDQFTFSTHYPILRKGTLTCIQEIRLWDFQQAGLITHMPDCLREVPPTSIEVSVEFSARIGDCEEVDQLSIIESVIQEKLLKTEGCDHILCNGTFEFNCSAAMDLQEFILQTKWTFSAPFQVEDYEDLPIVPDAETSLKTVLRKSYEDITSQKYHDEFKKIGLDLWPATYNRTQIRLICDEDGFVPDEEYRCVHCPTDTAEVDGQCVPCPEYHYQDQTGQTECLSCLPGSVNPRCNDDGYLVIPDCPNQTVNAWNGTYEIPQFVTSRNRTATVTCSPFDDTLVVQVIECDAVDENTGITASCTFNVTLVDLSLKSSDVIDDFTLIEDKSGLPYRERF